MRGGECVCVCVWVRGDACVRMCMYGCACDVCISVSASAGLSKDTNLKLQVGLVRPPQNELYSGKLVRLACGARVWVGERGESQLDITFIIFRVCGAP